MVNSAYSWNPTPHVERDQPPIQHRAPQPAPPRPQHGNIVIEGQVRKLDRGRPINNHTVIQFRIEQFDREGGTRREIPVQFTSLGGITGKSLELHDGDSVRVDGRWDQGTIVARAVENLTTKAVTKSSTWSVKKSLALAAAVLIVPAMIFIAVAIGLFSWGNQQWDQTEQQWCHDASEIGADFSQCDKYQVGSP